MQSEIYRFNDRQRQDVEKNEALAHAMQLQRLRDVIAKDVADEVERRAERREEAEQEERREKRSRLRAAVEAVGVCALGLGTMAVGIYMLWRAR